MKGFFKKVLEKIQGIVLKALEFVQFAFSYKVAFIFILWFFARESNWNNVVTVTAGVLSFLLFYVRELQKPDSGLAKIIMAWLGKTPTNLGG